LKANPDVLFDLTRRLLVGLDGLLFDLSRILSGSSTSKIAVVIYMLAMRFGVKNGAEIEIGLALPHQEIAHFAGLTRETTTIAIDKLVKDGIIVQRKRRIIVKDLKALKNGF
jgi:CRP-like cAMP-binding protein